MTMADDRTPDDPTTAKDTTMDDHQDHPDQASRPDPQTEVFGSREEQTTVLPTTPAGTRSDRTPEPAGTLATGDDRYRRPDLAVDAVDDRYRKTGPAPFTVVFGLVLLVVAGLAFAGEVTDFEINWPVTGPSVVVGLGVVLVLLGLLGMRRRTR